MLGFERLLSGCMRIPASVAFGSGLGNYEMYKRLRFGVRIRIGIFAGTEQYSRYQHR